MPAPPEVDDLGSPVAIPQVPRRIVSIVPSLTEAVAVTAPDLLVAATRWCIHPHTLDVARVGGTKNPDVDAIVALRPDVVLANEEENREPDLRAMRAAGLGVWVTRVRSLEEAFRSLRRVVTVACRREVPDWLVAAQLAWESAPTVANRGLAVVPVWRRPWMVVGRDTFAGDVLRRLGVRNAFGDHVERYPKVPLPELLAVGPDLVVLPDEPYPFGPLDGPESFPGVPCALVSGRHLTWYGPSLAEAPGILTAQLDAARGDGPGS